MLKITTTRTESNTLTVTLWGQLTEEYVSELETALDPSAAPQIVLEMFHVDFVDRKAMQYLCNVRSRVIIQNPPCYLPAWIEQECRCRGSQGEHSDK